MILLYEDESHIRDYQTLHATWFEKGKQKHVPTYGHHTRVNLFATVDAFTGDFFCTQAEQCNAQSFQIFLEQILDRYPGQHIVMVLDNARIHHARLIQPFLQRHEDHLTFLFLPPYSPNLNLVERMWKWLKGSVIANCFYQNRAEICSAVDEFVRFIQDVPQQVLKR
ncbi:IS630 family transposase, partial [Bacillus taeanensis]